MAEMLERAEDMNDFFFQYLMTLATSAEWSLTAPPRYGTTCLMRAFKLALEMPLKSREIEDKPVYKRLRKLMEEVRDLPTFHTKEWDECVKMIVAILTKEL
jgi:hypothetical protein